MAIQYPSAGAIYYTQFTPSSVQAVCDALKAALIVCGWTSTPVPSTALFTFTGLPTNTQTCTVGVKVYSFVTTIVNATPNQVKIGASAAACATNLYEAINAGANAGTDYSNSTGANVDCTATNPASGACRVTTVGTGFAASSRITVTSGLTNVTLTETTNNLSMGRGYKMVMPATPQGLSAAVWLDDWAATTSSRVRIGSVDGSVMSAANATITTQVGSWAINISAGRTLEFCGNAHQFFIFLLADNTTVGTKIICGVPFVRPAAQAKVITAASNATPISITATAHGFADQTDVFIDGVLGNLAANGFFTITVVDANTFTLNASVGSGAYTSGGLAAGGTAATAGISQISRCFFGQGDQENGSTCTWRSELSNGTSLLQNHFHCLNQYFWGTTNNGPSRMSLVHPWNREAGLVYNWELLADFVEPRLCWPVTNVNALVQDIGQLWASFLVMETQPMDRTNTGFDGHNWINFVHKDAGNLGSLWIAKS